jgi:hypothetical protein
VGLWLAGCDDARAEALRDAKELLAFAMSAGSAATDGEYQITDEDGETLFTISLKEAPELDEGEADSAVPGSRLVH